MKECCLIDRNGDDSMCLNKSLEKRRLERYGLFSTCALAKGKIYSFTSIQRIPMIMDLSTWKITLSDNIENYDSGFSVDGMLSAGDDIFGLELNGKRLMKYNICEKKCSYFNIGCNKKDWGNYAALAWYKNNIYIFPIYSDGVIKIDLESEKVQKEKSLYSSMYDLKKGEKQKEEFGYFWCGCQQENRVWLFQKEGNLAVAYDMESDTWQEYELSVMIKNCVHVVQYAGELYILNVDGEIYCWNVMNGSTKRMADCSGTSSSNAAFSRIAVTDKNIFLLPALGEDIFCIDLRTEEVNKYASYPENFQYCASKFWSKYDGYCEDETNYYFAMRSMNYILVINKKDGKGLWIKPEIPFYEEYRNIYIKNNRRLLTEAACSIEEMLAYLPKDSAKSSCAVHAAIGETIWKRV